MGARPCSLNAQGIVSRLKRAGGATYLQDGANAQAADAAALNAPVRGARHAAAIKQVLRVLQPLSSQVYDSGFSRYCANSRVVSSPEQAEHR